MTTTLDQCRTIAIDDDGTPFDQTTGEILDPADPEVRALVVGQDACQLAARITTPEEAERALERLARIDANILALRAGLDAITRNVNARIGAEQRRRDWWEFRYRPDVIEVARSMLGRTKTALFTFGRVSFRKSAGTSSIKDMDAAVAYVRQWDPAKVRVVESVTVTAIKEAMQAEAEALDEPAAPPPCLEFSGPRESVTIDTGIKAKD